MKLLKILSNEQVFIQKLDDALKTYKTNKDLNIDNKQELHIKVRNLFHYCSSSLYSLDS